MPAILVSYTAENHRRRLQNISVFEHGVRKCLRKHLITSYIPGQCLYNVTSKDREPTEQDEQELARFRDHGIGIVQTWDWFADPWSGHYLRPQNPRGARRLINLVHQYGMKLLPYTSTNFFERKDPAFRPEWAWPAAYDLVEEGWNLAHCSPSSPSWRAFVLPPLIRLLEDYGVDGLYNDLGYARSGEQPSYYTRRSNWAEDEVFAFREGPKHDGAMADMLALIYEEVKRRGLIYKLHKEATDTVYTNLKIYDYLWVGESVDELAFAHEMTKDYRPYVVPERSERYKLENEDELYLYTIPYMQFPMLKGGVEFGNPIRTTHARWLKLYKPMVEEGTWAWLEIADSDLFVSPVPGDVACSAFVNLESYLVIANFGRSAAELETADDYASVTEPDSPRKRWTFPARRLSILKRAA